MEKASLGAVAIVAAVAAAGMYFMREAYERQITDLQKQLEAAKQHTVATEKARQAEDEARRTGLIAVERARAEERWQREIEAKRTADAAREKAQSEKGR
jgi:hypothetical protein